MYSDLRSAVNSYVPLGEMLYQFRVEIVWETAEVDDIDRQQGGKARRTLKLMYWLSAWQRAATLRRGHLIGRR